MDIQASVDYIGCKKGQKKEKGGYSVDWEKIQLEPEVELWMT